MGRDEGMRDSGNGKTADGNGNKNGNGSGTVSEVILDTNETCY